MTSDIKLSVEERLALIKTLNRLPDAQFKELVYALDPPPGVIPPPSAPQGDRAPEALRWAENPDVGPGLAKLQEVLGQVLGKEPELPDSSASASFTEDLGNGATLEMIYIPEGRFWMGAREREEGRDVRESPGHRVSVLPFFMGKYPITQRQWYAVSLLDDVGMEMMPAPSEFKGNNLPVECVSWNVAVEFCARLSKKTGKAYRLPSEAEWEYACRARTTTRHHFGETISTDLVNYANHYKGTTEVGKFGENGFGLCDMHGNVWEWCLDQWHENYKGSPIDGSAWMAGGDDSYRVMRGGSWDRDPGYCRSAYRSRNNPVNCSAQVGFRVVCASSWTP